MITRMGAFLPLVGEAVFHPRTALRKVLDTPLERGDILRFAFLVIVLNLMLGLVADMVLPAPEGATPIPTGTSFVIHAASIFGGALMLHAAGRIFDGLGDFDGALKTVSWFYFVMMVAQAAFLVLLGLSQAAAGLAIILLLIFAFIQITAQTMELHGFVNPVPVFFGIIGAGMIFGFVMLALLSILGVDLPTAPPPTTTT